MSSTIPQNAVPNVTPDEFNEMIEYEKIVKFRDSVIAGTHPRIKLPTNAGKNLNSTDLSSTSNYKFHSDTKNSGQEVKIASSSESKARSPNAQSASASYLLKSEKSEINPVLLEKSDDLIKAEINLQRQRLERALREQVEHQRIAAKALLQTYESLPDFDVADVLSKAISIVPPLASPVIQPLLGGESPDKDSFDDNTFYSSQNETLSPPNHYQYQKSPTDKNIAIDIIDGQRRDKTSKELDKKSPAPLISSSERVRNLPTQNGSLNIPLKPTKKTQEKQPETNTVHSSVTSQSIMRESEKLFMKQPGSIDTRNTLFRKESDRLSISAANNTWPYQKSRQQVIHAEPIPNQVRNHNLSPVAPQPERVSPLATNPLILGEIVDEGQPAQITALRHAPPMSSADSSPRFKNSERKREKRKKRKVKGIDMPDSPQIKAEPKSTSPYPTMARPQKRHRSQYTSGVNYERPQPFPNMAPQDRTTNTPVWCPPPYDQGVSCNSPETEYEYRRIEAKDGSHLISRVRKIRRPQSQHFAPPYIPDRARPRAVSSSIGGRYLDDRDYVPEPMRRTSVRPDVGRERSRSPLHESLTSGPLRHIIVDENGRHYYDASPVHPIGRSMPPTVRYRDEDSLYERIPTRAFSSRIPAENFDSDNYMVRRRSPTYIAPRRVVTQPDYTSALSSNYRPYRQRAYSTYPTTASLHGEEPEPYRLAPESRQTSYFEEPPRGYMRSSTARPESIQYEAHKEYIDRMQHLRPDPITQGLELRRDTASQFHREYSVRPEPYSRRPESRRDFIPQTHREYSVRPMESYSQRETYVDRYRNAPSRMASHRENVMAQRSSSYYNEPFSRRGVDENNQIRCIDGSRYDERDRRLPADNVLANPVRVRESSAVVYVDEARNGLYR
ncbi:hypothetical protein GcC1_092009 [Golovinomyces cichoracearum]|uniref:Uncharacterized protein n=1 Tax=Golovinomyces cichoracearum TaxID=62708 RepID=A0A420IE50_9PEZI|nr:hypothetical protein GcC1_092009 [Golovinomyces cichoracearum]